MKNFLKTIALIVVTSVVSAQGFYNKGSVLAIATQTVLTVPDSLVNTGTIINNGDLRISGAWINQGTYDAAGTGKINFDSDLPQTINHNNQSFNRLVISGTGDKNFLADITIESELDLQSSNLKSVNGAKIILNPGVTLSGGSDQSHVIGPVEIHGSGDWLFPIGNETTYLPVEILGVTDANASATLTLYETGESLSGETGVSKLSDKRYWGLSVNGGTISNSSQIRLPIFDEALLDRLDLLVVAGSDVATSGYKSLGQSALVGDLSLGSVTSTDAPTLKFYAVASGETGIEVFNGISVNSTEGKNDFFRIKNIELYPDNTVAIFNRWGDKIFETKGYDNNQKKFNGDSKSGGGKVPAGTYFYSINLGDGSKAATGYLEIK